MTQQQTISSDYLAIQKELHKNPNYGVASLSYASLIKTILDDTGITSISDYGAGKQNLKKGLNDLGKTDFEYFPYDPAFPELGPPKPAQLVCCIDVLEHIEIDYLEAVLLELRAVTSHAGFFSIATGPAGKVLPDGRNAHIIQKPSSWWLPRLCAHFEIAQLQASPNGFWVLVQPRIASAS
jgi:hypothetical protein